MVHRFRRRSSAGQGSCQTYRRHEIPSLRLSHPSGQPKAADIRGRQKACGPPKLSFARTGHPRPSGIRSGPHAGSPKSRNARRGQLPEVLAKMSGSLPRRAITVPVALVSTYWSHFGPFRLLRHGMDKQGFRSDRRTSSAGRRCNEASLRWELRLTEWKFG